VDRSGTRIVGASDDGSLKIINLDDFTLQNDFSGHNDAVQCVGFSPNDAYVVSGSSDSTFKIWG
jgi:WD40 repeat protein